MKNRIQIKIQRAKRTLLGRALCRLAGNQAGAVMMEYVILGVLVAAAVTAAVIGFGSTIQRSLGVMSSATSGNAGTAATQATANQRSTATENAQAATSRQTIAPNQ